MLKGQASHQMLTVVAGKISETGWKGEIEDSVKKYCKMSLRML